MMVMFCQGGGRIIHDDGDDVLSGGVKGSSMMMVMMFGQGGGGIIHDDGDDVLSGGWSDDP